MTNGYPADLVSVLEAIADRAARLCESQDARIFIVEEDELRYVAGFGEIPFPIDPLRPLTRGLVSGRAAIDRVVVHVEDLAAEAKEFPESQDYQRRYGHRTSLAVPLVRGDKALGVILLRRSEVRPFDSKHIELVKAFADQAAVAIENLRLSTELKSRNAELTESLEQQTATAEILKVISSSPTDIQPVLDAVAESAARLCDANDVVIRRIDGDALRLVAHLGSIPVVADAITITRGTVPGCAVVERRTIHIHDILEAHTRGEYPEGVSFQRVAGDRSFLAVPLLREDVAVGVIAIRRLEVRPFSDKQIRLLETFAAQAVIAIENVRLFNETKEALEQQTATTEILRVISSSPTDIQPVLDAVAASAARLCNADDVTIRRVDGDATRIVAHVGSIPVQPNDGVQSLASRTLAASVVREGRTLQIPDVTEPQVREEYPDAMFSGRGMWGVRTILIVPLLRENAVIGTISMRRREVSPFSDKQVELLETFAAQAVIAIENVRLFNETKEALEQQTATAEILKVISSSPTDVQPVFDAIVKSGIHLFGGLDVTIRLVKGNQTELVATTRPSGDTTVLNPLDDDRVTSTRAILRREIVHIPDFLATDWVKGDAKRRAERRGNRALICAPMLREDKAIGVITISRATTGPFTDRQIALLKTFADQAVIAIENVRLFKELQARNVEITEALEQQTATSEILSVISGSPTDVMPVLDAVTHRAAQLCDAPDARLFLVDGDVVNYITGFGQSKGAIPRRPLHRGFVVGRAILDQSVVHIEDIVTAFDEFPDAREPQREFGNRTMLAVPLVREGKAFGAILMRRKVVRPFTDKQIALLKTFADQAVIAIENVRLFNETKEALEQQTVISEILRVISSSPTDTQPVFDAIVKSGLRLFGGSNVSLRLVKGDYTEIVAGTLPVYDTSGAFRIQLDDESVPSVRSVRRREFVHVPDILAAEWTSEHARDRAKELGFRAIMCAPMLRENHAVGSINVFRAAPGSFTEKQVALLKTFADQAVIAIENVRLFKELQARNAEITESLEQQTATAEILKVISSSPTDIQPVFDAILENATRLCAAHMGTLSLYNGEKYQRVAQRGANAAFAEWVNSNREASVPAPTSAVGRMIAERKPTHIPDLLESPGYRDRAEVSVMFVEVGGARTLLAVPMLKEGRVVGGITIYRPEVRPFTEKQIDLLSTFASQAVIAIENVRLFNETKEALEQQTVISEILRVISSSPTEVQPVFDAIVKSGVHLFSGMNVSLRLIKGDHIETVANTLPVENTGGVFPVALGDESFPATRAVLRREVVQIPDLLDAEKWVNPRAKQRGEQRGFRAIMVAPMLRENNAIGGITVTRAMPGPFTDKQVALLKTFADQAVIAIENVRLFKELQARNAEITESLEQQTATAEILKVISSSPTDTQPVFDAIVKSGVRLFRGLNVSLRLVKGDHTEMMACTMPERGPVIPLSDDGPISSRAILRREVVHVPDVLAADGISELTRRRVEERGFRAILCAPLLREANAIGAITVTRAAPEPFSDKEVALLKTFTDQAVIAIENVRLFNETKEALEQQTVISEILRVISSSPTDVQPVFDAIVKSGLHIFGGSTVSLRLVKGDHSERVASTSAMWGPGDEFIAPLDDMSIPSSRAMQRREVVQIPDAFVGDWVNPRIKQRAEQRGYRALMVAPLLRENRAIGTINVNKKMPGQFTEKQVALLKTFADQAVIAIENVRLFKELQARNTEVTEALEQQTATAEILKVISSSPTDIQPVFDSILEKATRLCDAHLGLLGLYDGERLETVAQRGATAEYAKFLSERGPFRPLPGGPFGRMIAERQPIHIEDRKDSPAYRDRSPNTVAIVDLGGARTYLAVPMLKEGRVVGGIYIYRPEVRPFTQKQIDLVSTFANQAIIAIENVRLFKELQARNAEITESLEQQTATSEILQVISGSPTDVTPVLEAVARSAAQLCDANDARVYVVDGDALRYVGGFGDLVGALPSLPLTRGVVTGRAVIDRSVVHIDDLAAVLDEFPDARGPQQSSGTRTTLAVPLVRESEAFGAILMRRKDVRPFTEKQIELVKTFAYQAAIGIENVRLFKEIQEKGRQLEVANKHKSEFLANMSHELRTPLNAVIGFSEALVEKMFGELNPKQEDYLRDIHSSGRHLLSLINDILDLSKVEAGRMELELSEFSLPMALKNAMTLVRERAQTHGIEMKLQVDPKLGDIQADERKFKQIVLNLLSNAVKFTPDGGRVEVDARGNGGSLKVSVKDTGVGIASKDQAALFEEFRQVGRGSTGKREGTGLGLALTRRFVELHGGTIGVESKPGKGSTFTFALPLKQVKQPVAKSKR